MDKEPKLPSTESEVGAGGVSHHVSHFLLIARLRNHYDEKHLAGSIAALEKLRNSSSDDGEIEKTNSLIEKLKSIDINAPVDLSLLKEIQSDATDIKDKKI